MMRWFFERQLAGFEKKFGYDCSYARDILRAGLARFLRFFGAFLLADCRTGVPKQLWWAAKITSGLQEDCGACVQLLVDMALEDGVGRGALHAILAGDVAGMGEEALVGFRFARAVAARDVEAADRLRCEITQRWGRGALVSLALSMAGTRVFPAVKYALGYGHACTRVRVGDAEVAVGAREVGV